MPVLVTGIHEINGTLGIPKTWMAGTRPGHDATGDGLAERVSVVKIRFKRGKSPTFSRRFHHLTGQPWA
jgi:hypothetical protein